MRLATVVTFLVLIAPLPIEAAELKGIVYENEVGGRPVPGVAVSSPGANPAITDAGGQFRLVYADMKPGDEVSVVVNKPGYVIVNDVQVETVTLSANPNQKLLKIFICKQTSREEMARRYYRLKSLEAIQANYQKLLKENQSNAVKLTQLQQERDQAIRAAEKTPEELAKTKPGEGSQLYKEAMRLFLDGQTDQALQVLDEEKLRGNAVGAQQIIEQTAWTWVLRARLLTVEFKFADAERAYLEALQIAPNICGVNLAYANFSQKLNHISVATEAYNHCLELAQRSGNKDDIAETLNNLGVLDLNRNRPDKARQALEDSLKIYRELANQNPSKYQHYLAGTLNNLGTVYRRLNRKDEARHSFDDSLKIYRELDDQTRGEYKPEMSMILHNLGLLHRDQKQLDDAHQAFKEALRIRRELADKNPNTYLPDVAKTLNSLGALYYDQKQMGDARQTFEEALKIRRELASKNPDTYLPDVAEILSNLGVIYRLQKRIDEAQKAYEESLKIYREVAHKNPDIYLPYVAGTLSNLGNLHRDQDRKEEARQAYEEALKIYQRFAEIDPEQFRSKVARVAHLLEELGADH